MSSPTIITYSNNVFTPSLKPTIIIRNAIVGQAKGYSFFHSRGMVGKGSAPIFRVDEPKKEKGQTFRIPLLKGLSGAGVQDTTELEGAEEIPVYSAVDGTLHLWRTAIPYPGDIGDQAFFSNVMKDCVPLLADWSGHKDDYLIIAALKLSGVYDTSDATYPAQAVCFGGNATSWSNIGENCGMSYELINNLSGLVDTRGIKPIDVPGYGNCFVLLVTPGQAVDLRNDKNWFKAQRNMPSGKDNPIFTGALGMLDNIIVQKYTCEPSAYGATAASLLYQEKVDGQTYEKHEAILLGAQAVGWGVAMEDTPISQEMDYGERKGVGEKKIVGAVKIQMNTSPADSYSTSGQTTITAQDYGVAYVATSAPILQRRAAA
jgi:N4-gp56 family major capsid protein